MTQAYIWLFHAEWQSANKISSGTVINSLFLTKQGCFGVIISSWEYLFVHAFVWVDNVSRNDEFSLDMEYFPMSCSLRSHGFHSRCGTPSYGL